MLLALFAGLPPAEATGGDLPLEPKRSWVEARTESFVVLGAVPQRVARRAALDLERLRYLLYRLQGTEPETADEPLVVMLFDDRRSFTHYSPFERARGIGGYLLPSATGPYLVVDASDHQQLGPTLFHEYVHAFLEERSSRPPLWYNEGLAELFSTLRFRRDRALVGQPSADHVASLASARWLPMEQVLAATPDSELYEATFDGQLFLAQAWALVHYLSTDPEPPRDLGSLLALLDRGVEPDEALVEAFGFGARRLEREVRRHVEAPGYLSLEATVPAEEAFTLAERELPDAETLARLGDLVAAQGPRDRALTRRLFEAALRLDPNLPLARRGLVRLEAGHLTAGTDRGH